MIILCRQSLEHLICTYKRTLLKTYFLFLLLICLIGKSQSLKFPLNNHSIYLSTKYQNRDNPFVIFENPSTMTNAKCQSFGFWGENKYLLKELNNFSFAFTTPTTIGFLGMGLNYFGNADYNETSLVFDYAHHLNNKSAVGILFQSQINKIKNSSNEYVFAGGVGMNIELNEKISTGICIRNEFGFNKSKDASLDSKIDLLSELKYDVTKDFLISTAIYKQYNQATNVVISLRYHYKKRMVVDYGFIGGVNQMYLGVGFSFDKMNLEVFNSFHPDLGYSPALLLTHKYEK